MLTAEQILADIKSDRVKKVIVDSDFSAECDDQYTLAYALGCDKMEVLAANAVAHYDDRHPDTYSTMLTSYAECLRVLHASGIDRNVFPNFQGASSQITHNKDFAPSDCPAVQNILKLARETDDIIYIITTGPCTDAVSAYLIDPSIADKICVVWLGGVEIGRSTTQSFHEWNMYADFKASQILLDSDIPLVMLHAGYKGSGQIKMTYDEFQSLADCPNGTSFAGEFYSQHLPRVCSSSSEYVQGWVKTMCDFEGTAVISVPDAVDFSIIPAPKLTDEGKYALDDSRKKIVWGENPNSDVIIADAVKCIKNVIINAGSLKIN